jgi:uncharacterized protein with GYD domain
VPTYLTQVSYSIEGAAAIVERPENRIDVVRPAVEKLGGKLIGGWYSLGEYDVTLIVDMPNNVAAAALAMAFSAGGAVKAVKTTVLLTSEEAVEAMRKASESVYKPPGGERYYAKE